MTLSNRTWKVLRVKPDFTPLDFSQRFRGKFSGDGKTIKGVWETSSDGKRWKRDFDLTYTKVNRP